jgi:hypothetical protein
VNIGISVVTVRSTRGRSGNGGQFRAGWRRLTRRRRYCCYVARQPTRRTRSFVNAAHERAAKLGQLRPVDPVARLVDGAPVLGRDQVYATRTGEVYHSRWCDSIADLWDTRPDALLVVREAEVGQRRGCRVCAG